MVFKAFLAASAAMMVAQTAVAADVPLIERTKLFGNPTKVGGRHAGRCDGVDGGGGRRDERRL